MKRREAIRSVVGGLTVFGGVVSTKVAVVEGSGGLRSNSVLVIQDADIHLERDFTLGAETQFMNCRFTGGGAVIVPKEFATRRTIFDGCSFDYSSHGEESPWIIMGC